MTETIRSKQYADSVALDDEEAVVRVLYESVLGLWGVGTMVVFLAILSLGWFYAYRERILEWQ